MTAMALGHRKGSDLFAEETRKDAKLFCDRRKSVRSFHDGRFNI